jgi:hypothetical protein
MSLILALAVLFGIGYMPEGGTVDIEGPQPVLEAVAPSIDLDLPGGIVYGPTYPAVYSEDLPIPTDPTSGTSALMAPLERIMLPREEPVTWPIEGEGYDWGPDYLIYNDYVGSGQDFDVDVLTNDIYAIFDTDYTTGDSLVVYKSTDGGVTWDFFICATNGDGAIINPRIVVAQHGGYTWVCMLGIWDESSGLDALWLRRVHSDGTGAVFEQVDDDVIWADMDADVSTSAWLYATYVPDGTANDIYAGRNALSGGGWVSLTSLFENPETTPTPAIAAGAGGNVTVALIDTRLTTNEEVRVKRSADYGASWLGSEQVSNNTIPANLSNPDIASDHQATQTAWITVTFEFATPVDNLVDYYSTNSCVTWTYDGVFPDGAGTDQNLSTARCNKTLNGVTVAFNEDPGDATMFTWANSSAPSSFSTPVEISDAAATGYWPPSAGWHANYSAVVYCRSAGYKLYFDAFDNTGIEDSGVGPVAAFDIYPNPFRGSASIGFSLTTGGPVTISVFDMSGRLVKTICDGQSFPAGENSLQWNGSTDSGAPLSAGVYFCRLSASGAEATNRMVLID